MFDLFLLLYDTVCTYFHLLNITIADIMLTKFELAAHDPFCYSFVSNSNFMLHHFRFRDLNMG